METKSLKSQYKAAKEIESGEKVYTFVASTSDPDRHGEVVNQDGWQLKNFLDNPIIGYQHNVWGNMFGSDDPDDVIGKAIDARIEDNQLVLDIVFDPENEKAMKIASKIDRGYLKTGSVGYRVLEWHKGAESNGEDPDIVYLDSLELMEYSIVNMPANPNAKRKEFRSQTFDALKYIYQELGGQLNLSEIEDMKLSEVVKYLDPKGDKTSETKEINKPEETNSEEQIDGNPIEQVQDEVDSDDLIKIEREREQESISLTELV